MGLESSFSVASATSSWFSPSASSSFFRSALAEMSTSAGPELLLAAILEAISIQVGVGAAHWAGREWAAPGWSPVACGKDRTRRRRRRRPGCRSCARRRGWGRSVATSPARSMRVGLTGATAAVRRGRFCPPGVRRLLSASSSCWPSLSAGSRRSVSSLRCPSFPLPGSSSSPLFGGSGEWPSAASTAA